MDMDRDVGRESAIPVFGFAKSQLWPIVESIAGAPVVSFEVTIEHRVAGRYGDRGDKVIPTFEYKTQCGHFARATVFVKRHCEPGPAEAYHYAYLAEHGAPIPRMYGWLTDQNKREVIFLEHLDVVTDEDPYLEFLSDPGRFRQFLSATARFNAIRPSGSYAEQLRRQEWGVQLTRAARVLENIWDLARKGELGRGLAEFCSGPRDRLTRLQTLAERLISPVSRMERGLCLYDHRPCDTGWRRETGELLIFDLEFVELLPRFWDMAEWLGAPEEVRRVCCPRTELAGHYLEEYVRSGGSRVAVDEFLEEARILWTVWHFTDLWWRRDRALGKGSAHLTKDDNSEYLRENRAALLGQLDLLPRDGI